MDYTNTTATILSLCTGSRGLERGLERAFTTLQWKAPKAAAYVEGEAFICYNLVKQMEQGLLAPAPIWTDCKTFPYSNFHNKIHGFVGGYPCQPFSTAGKRKGSEDPRHLWPAISQGIAAARPIWCFFENVPGHIELGFDEVYKSLRSMDYSIEAGIYSAEEVGSPHVRERLFILAIDSKKLGYSNSERPRRFSDAIEARQKHGIDWASRFLFEFELANSKHVGQNASKISKINNARIGGGKNKPSNGVEPERCCPNKMEHSHGSRLQQSIRRESIIKNDSAVEFASAKWPARPGETQKEWEPSRIESKMGYFINGYNFREDLLRMIGNAVVEDTAAVAFLDLITHKTFNQ